MVIWRGRGIVIAGVAFGCLIAAEYGVERSMGDTTYYQAHGWPKLLGFWLGASVVYALRSWLGVPDTTLAAEGHGVGPPAARAAEGELFFVKARYWPAILLVLGLVFLFVKE
jgi:hypothetical protein